MYVCTPSAQLLFTYTQIYTRTVYNNIINNYNYNDNYHNEGSWWFDGVMTYVKIQNTRKTVLKHTYSYIQLATNIHIHTYIKAFTITTSQSF